MAELKIAIMLSSLRLEPYEGMKKAAELGVSGLHISAVGGPFAPENIDAAGRKKLVKHINSLGLEISAIAAWGGQVHLEDAKGHPENIPWAKRLLALGADLECGICMAHVGIMPKDTGDRGWKNMVAAMQEIAECGEQVGACLAIETGPEPPWVLKRLIDTVGSEAIRVNYDPANLILWPPALAQMRGEEYDKERALADFEPTEGARVLGPYVAHTHAKDALIHPDGRPEEVPLGEGWVDWPRYIKYLEEAGYQGYFAIEREVGDNPVEDITMAVDFLRSL